MLWYMAVSESRELVEGELACLEYPSASRDLE